MTGAATKVIHRVDGSNRSQFEQKHLTQFCREKNTHTNKKQSCVTIKHRSKTKTRKQTKLHSHAWTKTLSNQFEQR